MTREEAIYELKNAAWLGTDHSRARTEEAVEMAIQALKKENIYDDKEHYVTISKALYDKLNIDYEALSQEPCETIHGSTYGGVSWGGAYKPQEPCDDAISRILKRMWNCRGKHTTSIDKVAMEQIIHDELPPVTHKSGKWNEYYTSQKGNNVFNCKECGHTFIVTQGKDNMNYCPNCGARMESEEQTV